MDIVSYKYELFGKEDETLKILAVGDIVGENGVKKLKEELPKIRQKNSIDFCIVNGENAAGGMGITTKIFNEMLNLKVDVITMGNHTWGKKDIFSFIDHPQIIRPANYSAGVVGKGMGIYNCKGKKIAVINLIGRTDMNVLSENPFLVAKDLVDKVKNNVDIIMVDFHAEATAEKIAMGYFLDGKVTAVYGTHTHVQTADEKILENGTAYITDIGMTGPYKSVIGMDVDASIKRFVTSLPERYKLAEGKCKLNGCIFDINDETCRVEQVTRLNIK
jgi:metallophosphoesterase (TIGR00282 family)